MSTQKIVLASGNAGKLKEFNAVRDTAIAYCKENAFLGHLAKWHKISMNLYEKDGDYKAALKYSKLIIESNKEKESKDKN